MSISQIAVLAGDNTQLQDEKASIEIGDVYRFKFDILRINGSSKNSFYTLVSIENDDNITIREGDIVQIEITDIKSEYGINVVSFWITIEGSNIERLEVSNSFSVMFFVPSSDASYYQESVDILNNPEEGDFEDYLSVEAFIENDRFYANVHYNQSYENNFYDYVEMEVFIPEGVISYLEMKFSFDYSSYFSTDSIPFNHLCVVSLDYPPIYAKGVYDGFDLYKFITVDIAGLVTDPFFYLILAELGGLLVLVMFLRKKGAF